MQSYTNEFNNFRKVSAKEDIGRLMTHEHTHTHTQTQMQTNNHKETHMNKDPPLLTYTLFLLKNTHIHVYKHAKLNTCTHIRSLAPRGTHTITQTHAHERTQKPT